MLTSKEAKIPNNLISVAKKTPGMTAGIVCADHDSSMDSAKKSAELDLIKPIFIGDKNAIKDKAEQIKWDLTPYEIIHSSDDKEAAMTGAELARDNKIKIMIKGNLHTDILMRTYLKKEYGLIEGKRLSHIWHMTLSENEKPLFITDGALNVSPRIDVKMHILKNVIDFAKRINISKPKVAILSGTEDPIESMPSSIEAREIMDRAIKENIEAYVHGPLAFDNAVSPQAAAIKNISNKVAGQADILLVPNLETGNSLSKIMVYFMDACAAGIVVGGKVPVVVPSRADSKISKLSSIMAAVVAAQS